MTEEQLNRPLVIDYKFQADPDEIGAFQDTSEGKWYFGQLIAKGTLCPDGVLAVEDSLSFVDDVGDVATCWLSQAINPEWVIL